MNISALCSGLNVITFMFQDYNVSVSKSKNVTKKLSSGVKNLPLYPNSPRLLPDSIQPVCQEMFLKSETGKTSVSPATSKSKQTSENPTRGNKKQKTDDDPGKGKKKAVTKRVKKGALDSSMISQATRAKYDIRYAMSKAQEKSKVPLSQDDTSDALFESMGAVAIFKDQAAKARKSPTASKKPGAVLKNQPAGVKQTHNSLFESVGAVNFFESQADKAFQSRIVQKDLQTGKEAEIICLEDSCDGFTFSSHVGDLVDTDNECSKTANRDLVMTRETFRKLLSKPLNASICDRIDTLSIDDLVSLVSENLDAIRLPDCYAQEPLWTPRDVISSSSEAEDSTSDPVFHDIPLPSPPHSREHPLFMSDDDAFMELCLDEQKEANSEPPQPVFAVADNEIFDDQVDGLRQPPTASEKLSEQTCLGDTSDFHLEKSKQRSVPCETSLEKSVPVCSSPKKGDLSTEVPACKTPLANLGLAEGYKSPRTPEVSMVTVTQALAMVASFKKKKEPDVKRHCDRAEKEAGMTEFPQLVDNTSKQKITSGGAVNNDITRSPIIDAQIKNHPFSEEKIRSDLPVCDLGKDLITESFVSQNFQTMNPSQFNQEIPQSPLRSLPLPVSARNITLCVTPSHKNFPSDDDVSPSLVSSGAINRMRNSKVKKSLDFHNPTPQFIPSQKNLNLFGFNSDDDLFAEDEKIKCTQNEEKIEEPIQLDSSPLTQLYNISDLSPFGSEKIAHDNKTPNKIKEWPPPRHLEKSLKTAVVRPLGFESVTSTSENDLPRLAPLFENRNSGWLSTENKPKSPTLLSLTKKKHNLPRKLNKAVSSNFKGRNLGRTSPPCRSRLSNDGHEWIPSFRTSSVTTQSRSQAAPVNTSFSTFDCIPDDLTDFLDASPINAHGHVTPVQQRKPAVKQSTPLFGVTSPSLQCVSTADDELSDGALEAIRAVEEFEKAIKPMETSTNTSSKSGAAVFDLWPSDDSDELFEKNSLSCQVRRKKILSPKTKEKRRRSKTHVSCHTNQVC